MKQILLFIETRSTQFASGLAMLFLALAVVCGAVQVIARFVFNHPADWTEVLTRVSLIWMVYLGTALALRQGALVSVDLFYRLCKGRAKRAAELAITACTLSMLFVMIYYGGLVAWKIRFQEIAGLEISMSWAYLAIPTGALFSVLAVLGRYFDPARAAADELGTAQ
jgi:TRAP-type C4-dicarboxylate transport system permease small subunit